LKKEEEEEGGGKKEESHLIIHHHRRPESRGREKRRSSSQRGRMERVLLVLVLVTLLVQVVLVRFLVDEYSTVRLQTDSKVLTSVARRREKSQTSGGPSAFLTSKPIKGCLTAPTAKRKTSASASQQQKIKNLYEYGIVPYYRP
jgi:hypothetical protein